MNSKEKIYNAAKRLYIEQGYDSTPNTQVAKEAGVNLGLVTYYYKTKDLLASDILNENFEILYSYLGQYVPKEDQFLTLITFNRLSSAITMIDPNFDRFIYEMNRFDLVENSIRTGRLLELYQSVYSPNPSVSEEEQIRQFDHALTAMSGSIRALTVRQYEGAIDMSRDEIYRISMQYFLFSMNISTEIQVYEALIYSASLIVERILQEHPVLTDVRNFLYQ